MRKIIIALGLLAGNPAYAQSYKPDFDCSKVNQGDSIAVMLCQNSDAAKAELQFDQAYYALRQVVGKNGWKALKQEAIKDDDAFATCIDPSSADGSSATPQAHPDCYISTMKGLTEKYRSRLSGAALQEASRDIDQHIALQQKLIDLGYLPAGSTADGVYGEGTREAIETWQRVSRRPSSDGFISDADAQVLLVGGAPQSSDAADASQMPTTGTPLASQEAGFVSIIDSSRQEYESGQNDFQKGASRPRRASKICSFIQSPVINNWSGTVEDLSSTSNGLGVVKIRISDHITVGTSNNSFSDSIAPQRTLILPSDPVFSQVANLHVGQKVNFSGIFSTSKDDCLFEISLTQAGSMEDPDFEMKFTNISPSP